MQTVNQVLMILQSAVGRVDVSVIRNVIAHVDLAAMLESSPKQYMIRLPLLTCGLLRIGLSHTMSTPGSPVRKFPFSGLSDIVNIHPET